MIVPAPQWLFPEQIRNLIPGDWFAVPAQSSVWLRGYRAERVAVQPQGMDSREVDGKLLITLFGRIRYPTAPRMECSIRLGQQPDDDRVDVANKLELRESVEGSYVVLVVPFNVDGVHGHPIAVTRELDATSGLLVALLGASVIHERIFDYTLTAGPGGASLDSSSVPNPLWYPRLTLNRNGTDPLQHIATNISGFAARTAE